MRRRVLAVGALLVGLLAATAAVADEQPSGPQQPAAAPLPSAATPPPTGAATPARSRSGLVARPVFLGIVAALFLFLGAAAARGDKRDGPPSKKPR